MTGQAEKVVITNRDPDEGEYTIVALLLADGRLFCLGGASGDWIFDSIEEYQPSGLDKNLSIRRTGEHVAAPSAEEIEAAL